MGEQHTGRLLGSSLAPGLQPRTKQHRNNSEKGQSLLAENQEEGGQITENHSGNLSLGGQTPTDSQPTAVSPSASFQSPKRDLNLLIPSCLWGWEQPPG